MANRFSFNSLFNTVSKLIDEEVTEAKLSPQQKSHQQEIENSVLVLAAAVLRCDKNFNARTEEVLTGYFARHFGSKGKAQRITAVSGHMETGTEPFVKIACKELKLLTTHDSHKNIVYFLFTIAAADDFINARETRCIHRIAGYLGISAKDFNELKQNFLSMDSPYFILGIEEGASLEEAKSAYRKMILKYHPDKAKGKTSEEDSLKFREVKRAFEAIKNRS